MKRPSCNISWFPALLLCLAALGAASPALAQVYEWIDPESGRKRLSNVPPPWLRQPLGERPGPRVQVYFEGRLADDTGLPWEKRVELRAQSPIGRYLPAPTGALPIPRNFTAETKFSK